MRPARLDITLAYKTISLVPSLSGLEKRVGAALLDHYNQRTGQCDPGIERLAWLLGCSERTVIRATQRLVQEGLFNKVVNGGHFLKNQYEPSWHRCRELEREWRVKFEAHARARRASRSPIAGQGRHVSGASAVTQTSTPNQSNKTSQGLASQDTGEKRTKHVSSPTHHVSLPSTSPIKFAEVARQAAERRWSQTLTDAFAASPVTHAKILENVTPELTARITDIEVQRPGRGYPALLAALKVPLNWNETCQSAAAAKTSRAGDEFNGATSPLIHAEDERSDG
jgi:hypothetical protein